MPPRTYLPLFRRVTHTFCMVAFGLAALCAPHTLCAQTETPQPRPLYKNGEAPGDNGLSAQQVKESGGILRRAVEADYLLFRPDPRRATRQAVVICPGGGYSCTCYGYEGITPAQWFQEQGILALVLRYRMPNGHPDIPLADATQALRMLRDSAAQWHIDPTQIGILGFSAGGHLAASAATLIGDSTVRPAFSILIYPVITMKTPWGHAGSRDNLLGPNAPEALRERYSLEKQVTRQTSPTFLALTHTDRLVPAMNSVLYYEALAAHGVPAELHIYPTGDHGFAWRTDFPYHDELLNSLSRWLSEQRKR